MKNFFKLSIGNKIAVFSLVVAIVTLVFGVYQYIAGKKEIEQNKNTSIVTGGNSTVVNRTSGDVIINYSSKR